MRDPDELLSQCTGFQWDEGNSDKNEIAHGVTQAEAEQLFFNVPLMLASDWKHSEVEDRYYGLGITDAGRPLFFVFTVRGTFVRVISARDMSRRERQAYEQAKER